MIIGIPQELLPGERAVAATPTTITALMKLGYEVVVESGAGEAANFSDASYQAAGATIGTRSQVWATDVIATLNPPTPTQVEALTSGATLIAPLHPTDNEALIEQLNTRLITALALDAVPRISRAQSLDVLSTLSNISGYRGVIEAAQVYGGMFSGQVTAAGKTPPAKVFVIGGGVAGLAAIGAAVSLGASVRAFDVRPEAAEQIESMGATFVHAGAGAQQEVSATGYASELSDEQERLTTELYARESAQADIVITTALVRGRAPRTITAAMASAMRPGSVIVDLAASGGGNCELTVPGEKIVTAGGVTILGYTDLTSRMPRHTSQLLGTNIVNLLKLLTPGKDGVLALNLDDAVQRGMTVSHQGRVLWPPPPVEVSATPTSPTTTPAGPSDSGASPKGSVGSTSKSGVTQPLMLALSGSLLAVALAFTDVAFLITFTVFTLAVFVGYYVISNVSHSLHTPLMSQTNAISGIILVGALLQIGSDNLAVTILAAIAATVASINVFGGFLVTYRMLGMFQKEA